MYEDLKKIYNSKGFKFYETDLGEVVNFPTENHSYKKNKSQEYLDSVIGCRSLMIIEKMIKLLVSLPNNILKRMGIDQQMVDLFSLKILNNENNILLSRFDMVENKTIELNSLTPFMLEESIIFDGDEKSYQIFSNHYNNYILSELKRKNIPLDKCNFIASSCSKELSYEDFRVTEFIKESVENFLNIKIQQVSHEDLAFDFEKNKLTYLDKEIDVWINPTLPVEFLLDDENDIGIHIISQVASDNLIVLNPFESYFAQNKALYALIWENRNNEELFSKEEREFIKLHFPRTSFFPDEFINSGEKYVKKSVFGREGSNIEIIDPKKNEVIYSNSKGGYENFGYIYQEFLEAPKVNLKNSLNKDKECFLIKGPFFIKEQYISTAYRAGEIITSVESYYLV